MLMGWKKKKKDQDTSADTIDAKKIPLHTGYHNENAGYRMKRY